MDFTASSTDSVKISTIEGIIFGPHSTTFKQYLRESFRDEDVMNHCFDQWRYVTLVTPMRTYDFILGNQKDSLDFIVALNEAMFAYKREVVRKRIQAIEDGSC